MLRPLSVNRMYAELLHDWWLALFVALWLSAFSLYFINIGPRRIRSKPWLVLFLVLPTLLFICLLPGHGPIPILNCILWVVYFVAASFYLDQGNDTIVPGTFFEIVIHYDGLSTEARGLFTKPANMSMQVEIRCWAHGVGKQNRVGFWHHDYRHFIEEAKMWI